LENKGCHFRRTDHCQETVGRVDQSVELFKIHNSLGPLGHFAGFMVSLQTQLPAVSFEEEVGKFKEGDSSTAVNIKSEDVLHDIVDFVLALLLEHLDHDLLNCLDLDLLVALEVGLAGCFEFTPQHVSEFLGGLLHFDGI